jgi:pyrrolidone-carboxylate peptidase
MPQTSHATAQYDPARSAKRDLIVLVTGFGDFGDITHNPATAVAEALNGKRDHVVNKWGTTIYVQIVGVGEVPVNFQDDGS